MFKLISVTPRGAFAFSHDIETIPLDKQGLVALLGPNGSGKSSIMNSVTTALFGKNDLGYEGDDVINRVLDDGCNIQVVFEVDAESYYTVEYCRKFRRSGKARETDVFLTRHDYGGEADLRGESQSDTFARIRRLVGLDYSQFVATSYLGTQTAPRFLNGTDSARMEIITPFLGLGIWDEIQVRVREALNTKRSGIEGQIGARDSLLEQAAKFSCDVLSEGELLALKAEMAGFEANKTTTQAEIDRVLVQSRDHSKRVADLRAEIAAFDRESRGLSTRHTASASAHAQRVRTAQSSVFEGWDAKVRALDAAHVEAGREWAERLSKLKVDEAAGADTEELEDATHKWQQAAAGYKAQIAVHQAMHVDAGTCPTCQSEVSDAHVAQIEATKGAAISAAEDGLAEVSARITEAKAQIGQIRHVFKAGHEAKIASYWDERCAWDAIEFAKRTEAETQAQNSLAAWRKKHIDEMNTAFALEEAETAARIAQLATLRARVEEQLDAAIRDPAAQDCEKRLFECRRELAAYQSKIDAHLAAVAVSTRAAQYAAQCEKQATEASSYIVAVQSQIQDLEFLEKHVGDKGFKRFKLRSCIGFMNERLAHHMSVLGLPLQVWLQDRELKKSALRKKPEDLREEDWADRFEMFVRDGVKERVPVGMYSGGERTLISLSLLGTLWETANLFGGGGSNVLMLDEPFGLLHSDNRDRAVALLEHWRSASKSILVSDNTGAVDAVRADTQILIEKKNHVSTYRLLH